MINEMGERQKTKDESYETKFRGDVREGGVERMEVWRL
jgi:hypothetical protein